MKKTSLFLIIILLVALQATIFNFLKLWQVKPELLLLCMVIISLYFDLKWSLIFSLLLGLLKDVFSGPGFGFNTIFFPLASFLIIYISKKVPLENNLLRLLIVLIAVLLHSILAAFFYGHLALGIFLRITILEAFLTGVIAYVIFRMLRCAQE